MNEFQRQLIELLRDSREGEHHDILVEPLLENACDDLDGVLRSLHGLGLIEVRPLLGLIRLTNAGRKELTN